MTYHIPEIRVEQTWTKLVHSRYQHHVEFKIRFSNVSFESCRLFHVGIINLVLLVLQWSDVMWCCTDII